ncbi:hypothetical protein HPP92_013345 [Vanilla planifolia]|uniref:Uncharacterized protein n=1 Tax=Vanilla planifolia TaxID=51239 RepID=A0A835QUR3_VANPL|nr:hypothetical protein HPP92_013345 [Vanilla planifolia]
MQGLLCKNNISSPTSWKKQETVYCHLSCCVLPSHRCLTLSPSLLFSSGGFI